MIREERSRRGGLVVKNTIDGDNFDEENYTATDDDDFCIQGNGDNNDHYYHHYHYYSFEDLGRNTVTRNTDLYIFNREVAQNMLCRS